MDIVIVLTEKCVCKRQVISVTGRCGICIKEGSEAFWLYMDGKISFPSFMRRLRKHG